MFYVRKRIAITLVIVLVAQHVPAAPFSHTSAVESLGISPKIGIVTDAHFPAKTRLARPEVILLQDMHAHRQAQENIAAFIRWAHRKWEVRRVHVEGAYGP